MLKQREICKVREKEVSRKKMKVRLEGCAEAASFRTLKKQIFFFLLLFPHCSQDEAQLFIKAFCSLALPFSET